MMFQGLIFEQQEKSFGMLFVEDGFLVLILIGWRIYFIDRIGEDHLPAHSPFEQQMQ